MSKQSWWQRAIAAVTNEYERRIRRASLVTEDGAAHHSHDDHDDHDAAEIVNLPRGAPVGRRPTPEPDAPSGADAE